MLDFIVGLSLRFRGVVIALAVVLLGYGVHVAMNAKFDVFPEFAPPQVTVQTESPGLSPEQVETLVTRPVEAVLNGVRDLQTMRSDSFQGFSTVTCVFKDDADIRECRRAVSEKLGELAGGLPSTAKAPSMSPLTSATMDLLKVGLVSDKLTPMELRLLAERTLRPKLMAVRGVARCIIYGGEPRRIRIAIDREKLHARGLTPDVVLAAAGAACAPGGAGFTDTPGQRLVIDASAGDPTPETLGATPLTGFAGNNVRLSDVAEISYAPAPKYGDAVIQGKPGVLLATACQYGSNTLEVTRALEASLDELKPMLAKQGVTLYPGLHRPATFVESSLRGMGSSLAIGALLVAVVLVIFLGNLRVALISITAIPLSLLGAIMVLDRFGVTINTLTLGGLAIAIGEVVDDAIIDAENIFHRLRENRASASPRPVLGVIREASLEVRGAVVYATFVVVLVFMPVLTLSGIQGRFFAPLAASYILAILASLAVALTLTPALSMFLLGGRTRTLKESRMQSSAKKVYSVIVRAFAKRPMVVMIATPVLLLPVFALLPDAGGELLPAFREGHFVVHMNLAPGASLEESARVGRLITEDLLKIEAIATVEQQIGRAEQGEDPFGPDESEFHIELKHVAGVDDTVAEAEIRKVFGSWPGIRSETMTFLGDRIGETITGETAPVVVNLFGEDLDVLDAKATVVKKILEGVPGATDVRLKAPDGEPRLSVRPDFARMAVYGFKVRDVYDLLEAAGPGVKVGRVPEGVGMTDVAVTLSGGIAADPGEVGALLLRNASGIRVPLREVATVKLTSGRKSIGHEGARRRRTITCNANGVGPASFTESARRAVTSKANLPAGCYAEFSGSADAEKAATRELLAHALMAGAGVVILIRLVMRGWRNTGLILLNLPFALVGGVLGLRLAGIFLGDEVAALSLGPLVGFVTLFGITTRNSIMMISHYEHLVHHEGVSWGLDTAVRGAAERLTPVLMTALVTGIGLVPLVIGAGRAGSEIEGPMAIVILGGLFTSTLLNLLVLPSLALRFARFA